MSILSHFNEYGVSGMGPFRMGVEEVGLWEEEGVLDPASLVAKRSSDPNSETSEGLLLKPRPCPHANNSFQFG